MTRPFSPVMLDAVERAKAHGALYRWPGGFWTNEPYTAAVHAEAARRGVDAVPSWWVGTATVSALFARRAVGPVTWHRDLVGGRKVASATLLLTQGVQ